MREGVHGGRDVWDPTAPKGKQHYREARYPATLTDEEVRAIRTVRQLFYKRGHTSSLVRNQETGIYLLRVYADSKETLRKSVDLLNDGCKLAETISNEFEQRNARRKRAKPIRPQDIPFGGGVGGARQHLGPEDFVGFSNPPSPFQISVTSKEYGHNPNAENPDKIYSLHLRLRKAGTRQKDVRSIRKLLHQWGTLSSLVDHKSHAILVFYAPTKAKLEWAESMIGPFVEGKKP